MGGIKKWVCDDIEIREDAEEETPGDGAVSEFFAKDGFAYSGSEDGLGKGIQND